MYFSKKLSLGLIGGLTFAVMSSCSDEDLKEVNNSSDQSSVRKEQFSLKALFSDEHTISQREAESIALEFIKSNKSVDGLKSVTTNKIENTVVLTYKGTNGLKSGTQSPDTLAYIVNLSNEGGFVYVCADNRETDPVMAVFERGSYNADSIAAKPALANVMICNVQF